MRTTLSQLLQDKQILLADGATGTNLFAKGLTSGEPPEFWNFEHPDRVIALHQSFVDAGSDIILTNTFGSNAHRLALHNEQARVFEFAQKGAQLARQVVDASPRKVVVAGSIGPTGSLFEPLGTLNHDEAVDVFSEQVRGLIDGGADVGWIETMSAAEEIRAAAQACINYNFPYVATVSFDTAGRTMMGLAPDSLSEVFQPLTTAPLAYGANCGVGASDMLVSVLEMTKSGHGVIVAKGNCGLPKFAGTEIFYTGTPELMGDYAHLAIDAGARIIGGCCGTSPEHLVGMRAAIDSHVAGSRPSQAEIEEKVGPLTNSAPTVNVSTRERRRRTEPQA